MTLDPAYALTAFVLALIGGAWYAIYRFMGPQHYFTVWLPGGGEKRFKMKTLGEKFTWTDPTDAKPVIFPLDPTFARATKKGMRYYGDAATGLLVRWDHHEPGWLELDGKLVAVKLKDGREQNLAAATNAGKYDAFLPYIPMILGGILVALIVIGYFMYQVYHGQHPATAVAAR